MNPQLGKTTDHAVVRFSGLVGLGMRCEILLAGSSGIEMRSILLIYSPGSQPSERGPGRPFLSKDI